MSYYRNRDEIQSKFTVRDTGNIQASSTTVPPSVTESLDSSALIMTGRKQSFIIDRLYSERPVFTVTIRVVIGMTCHDLIEFPLARWSQRVMYEDDFGQSLDNVPFWALLKSMQVITEPRLPKIFGYLLNHLSTQKSIFI